MTAAAAGVRGAVLRAMAVTTAVVMPVFLFAGLSVQVGADLGFSVGGLGLAVALYFAASSLTSIPAGWCVEHFGPRAAGRAGVVIAAGAMLGIAAFARSFSLLVVLLMVGACANGLGQLATNHTLSRKVPQRRQGLSFGAKQAAIPAATLLTGAAVPAIALTLGWRAVFALAGVLALMTWLLVPRDEPATRDGAPAPEQSRATMALVVVGAGAGCAAGAGSTLGLFLVDAAVSKGIGAAAAGGVLIFGSVIGLIGRIGAGWVADHRAGAHLAMVAGMLTVGAVGLGLLALPFGWALLLGTALGYGLGWAWPGVLNFAVARLHPAAPAAATSITQSGVYLGGFVGPLAFGFVAEHLSYAAAWLGGGVVLLLAAVLMITGRRMLLAHGPTREMAQRLRSQARPAGS